MYILFVICMRALIFCLSLFWDLPRCTRQILPHGLERHHGGRGEHRKRSPKERDLHRAIGSI